MVASTAPQHRLIDPHDRRMPWVNRYRRIERSAYSRFCAPAAHGGPDQVPAGGSRRRRSSPFALTDFSSRTSCRHRNRHGRAQTRSYSTATRCAQSYWADTTRLKWRAARATFRRGDEAGAPAEQRGSAPEFVLRERGVSAFCRARSPAGARSSGAGHRFRRTRDRQCHRRRNIIWCVPDWRGLEGSRGRDLQWARRQAVDDVGIIGRRLSSRFC